MRKIFIVACSILLSALIFSLPLLVRVNIECMSQYGECPSEVLRSLSAFNGKNLAAANSNIKKYLKSSFLVSEFQLQFKLPNVVKINLIVKKPVFAVRDKASSNVFLASIDGKVLSVVKSSALPTVEANVSAKVGDSLDPKIVFASELVSGVFEMYQVSFGRIDGDSLLVDLPRQIRVIFPVEGDSEVLLGSLRLIYTKITAGEAAGKYREIDLRFKNPVLR